MAYEKKKRFISKPAFEGGEKGITTFLKKEVVYPKVLIKENVTGHVTLMIDINGKGKVVDAKVTDSLHPLCDKEAIKAVKKLQFSIPNTAGKMGKVLFHRKVRVPFAPPLQNVKPVSATFQYRYVVTPANPIPIKAKDAKQSAPAKSTPSYGYTIKI